MSNKLEMKTACEIAWSILEEEKMEIEAIARITGLSIQEVDELNAKFKISNTLKWWNSYFPNVLTLVKEVITAMENNIPIYLPSHSGEGV